MKRYELMRKHYGQIKIASIPSEVRTIWYTKEQEPDPCEVAEEYRFDNDFGNCEITRFQDKALLSFILQKANLSPMQESALLFYYFDNGTLRTAAKELQVTPERVRQILGMALRKLRRACYTFSIKGYDF